MYVYILHSAILDKYYVGACTEVQERLKRHLTNHKGFTGRSADWKLVYSEVHPDKTTALLREKKIKSWKSRKMMEKLIAQR